MDTFWLSYLLELQKLELKLSLLLVFCCALLSKCRMPHDFAVESFKEY